MRHNGGFDKLELGNEWRKGETLQPVRPQDPLQLGICNETHNPFLAVQAPYAFQDYGATSSQLPAHRLRFTFHGSQSSCIRHARVHRKGMGKDAVIVDEARIENHLASWGVEHLSIPLVTRWDSVQHKSAQTRHDHTVVVQK